MELPQVLLETPLTLPDDETIRQAVDRIIRYERCPSCGVPLGAGFQYLREWYLDLRSQDCPVPLGSAGHPPALVRSRIDHERALYAIYWRSHPLC